MRILVRVASGRELADLELLPSDGELKVKRAIERSTGIPPLRQRLVHGIVPLRSSLADTGIEDGGCLDLVILPLESFIVTWSGDCCVKIWNVDTGECLQTFEDENEVSDAFLSADGSFVLTKQCLPRLEDEEELDETFFSSGGASMLSKYYEQKVTIWDTSTGRFVASMICGSLSVSPYGSFVLDCENGEEVELHACNATGFDHRFTLSVGGAGSDFCTNLGRVRFSSDCRLVLTLNRDGIGKIWDLASGEQVHSFAILKAYSDVAILPNDCLEVMLSPSGSSVLSYLSRSDEAGSVSLHACKLWSVRSGDCTHTLGLSCGTLTKNNSFHFSPNGALLLCCSAGGLCLLSSESGAFVHELQPQGFFLDVTTDGSCVLYQRVGNLSIWDTQTGACLQTLVMDDGAQIINTRSVFSADGRSVLVPCGWRPPFNVLHIYNVKSGQRTLTLQGHEFYVTGVANVRSQEGAIP